MAKKKPKRKSKPPSPAERERNRCVEICDIAIDETGGKVPELYRVRNMIANGLKPITFLEQLSELADE